MKKLIIAMALALVCFGHITPASATYIYTQSACPSGNECISDITYPPSSTTASASTMVGWNISANDTGYANLYNFTYASGATTDNTANQSRNRNGVTGRAACFYTGSDIMGSKSRDDYSLTVYWRNFSFGNDVASSFRLVAQSAAC